MEQVDKKAAVPEARMSKKQGKRVVNMGQEIRAGMKQNNKKDSANLVLRTSTKQGKKVGNLEQETEAVIKVDNKRYSTNFVVGVNIDI